MPAKYDQQNIRRAVGQLDFTRAKWLAEQSELSTKQTAERLLTDVIETGALVIDQAHKRSEETLRRRDEFSRALLDHLVSAGLSEAELRLKNHLEDAELLEEGFAAISSALKTLTGDIEPADHLWSSLNESAKTIARITDSKSFLAALRNQKQPLMLHAGLKVRLRDGQELDPDVAVPTQVDAITKTLQLLAHENDWVRDDGSFVFPARRPCQAIDRAYALNTAKQIGTVPDTHAFSAPNPLTCAF